MHACVRVCCFVTQFRDLIEKSNYKLSFLMKAAQKSEHLVVNCTAAEANVVSGAISGCKNPPPSDSSGNGTSCAMRLA